MIKATDVMPLLLEACPSFAEPWKDYVSDAAYEEGLLYVDLGQFAGHVVGLMKQGLTSEFPSVFAIVERLHAEGDAYVKEAATIGLLEGIQNHAGHENVDSETFRQYLGPESARWWNEVNQFWDGKSPYVGSGLRKPEGKP